ncbi:hypothetical protein BSKO_08082 [Bryopsis sp. KO-2023]|nr:hypothetical protein BSKO_08082 [Bryopsis sp. KO-2023]
MAALAQASRPLASRSELPLLNRRVLITAPRQYASKLGSYLLDAGARPIWVPAIEVTSLPEQETFELDGILTSLKDFTHLAFTSKNGIHAVMDQLVVKQGGFDQAVKFIQSSKIKLCALGADALVLQSMGLVADVQPKEASTLGLVREFVERNEADGAAVLCPVPSVRGGLVEPPIVPRFLAALEASGAEPHRIDAYVTQIGSTPEQCIAEKELLSSGDIDAIIFSSTAEAQGLVQLMGSVDIIGQAVENHGVILAAHGPYTAKGAGEVLGMDISCVSKSFSTFEGVVAALEAAYSKNP